MKAIVRCRPWRNTRPPGKILVIRFQALGDTIITLPYVQSIRSQYPDVSIHLFTRKEVASIPQGIELFDKVIVLGGGRNARLQFVLSLFKLPFLIMQRYDMVLDLQHHRFSKIISRILNRPAWAEFDRSSPMSAGERTRQTIEAVWSWKIEPVTSFKFKNIVDTDVLLLANGWRMGNNLVILNPAGFAPAREWPLEHYVAFANAWLKHHSAETQFVLLLLPALQEKASYIADALGSNCINLTGKADALTAFAIVQRSKFVLSEDSGLMHMAWIQGIPTLALFSSSRKDWSAPQGEHSDCLDSSDLECGPCMKEICIFGDNRCLTRYSPMFVYERSVSLLESL